MPLNAFLAVRICSGDLPKKTAQGRVGVPAQIKEATQPPAQHRQLQLQASEEERLINLPTRVLQLSVPRIEREAIPRPLRETYIPTPQRLRVRVTIHKVHAGLLKEASCVS
jgi:hypothetical protein